MHVARIDRRIQRSRWRACVRGIFHAPRSGRVDAASGPRWPRVLGLTPPRGRHRSRIDQTGQIRRGTAIAVIKKLVDEALPTLATMDQEVFHRHQAIQVDTQLRIGPTR